MRDALVVITGVAKFAQDYFHRRGASARTLPKPAGALGMLIVMRGFRRASRGHRLRATTISARRACDAALDAERARRVARASTRQLTRALRRMLHVARRRDISRRWLYGARATMAYGQAPDRKVSFSPMLSRIHAASLAYRITPLLMMRRAAAAISPPASQVRSATCRRRSPTMPGHTSPRYGAGVMSYATMTLIDARRRAEEFHIRCRFLCRARDIRRFHHRVSQKPQINHRRHKLASPFRHAAKQQVKYQLLLRRMPPTMTLDKPATAMRDAYSRKTSLIADAGFIQSKESAKKRCRR